MNENQPLKLRLFASTTYPVQLARSVSYRSKERLDVHAEVNPETGEVRLLVELQDLAKYLKNN